MSDEDDLSSDNDENKSPGLDDSDDSLSDGPDFLSSVVGSSSPLSTVNTNVLAEAGQSLASDTGQAHFPTTVFSLDSLLHETKRDEEKERETLALQAKLRKELQSNRSLSQEENEDDDLEHDGFTDEQKQQLEMLKLEEAKICDSAPGESVLSDALWARLFSENLSPAACGVSIDNTHPCLRQLFQHYQPYTLMDILSSDIISLAYDSLPCKSQIQQWLFFIMTIHSSTMEVEKCADQLLQVLQWQMGDLHLKHTWTPQLADWVHVFVNWGADLKNLVFDSSVYDQQQLQAMLPMEVNHPPAQQDMPVVCHRNLEPTLKVFSNWLQARPGYSTEELNQLLLMLCHLSLDHSLCKVYLLYELQVCLASVLECYQPSEWTTAVPWLCRRLAELSSHHHNQVYVTQLFTSCCPRSRHLQQRLAFLLLHSTLTSLPLPDADITHFQLTDLLSLIPEMKPLLHSDNYRMSSLVQLIDLCVGPAGQHITQRKQLFQLAEAVRLIVSEIRDSVQRLDCTKVKGMLMHLCLKWDLAVKANNIKQRKIFNCFSSKAQMQVEQLEDQASSVNDDDTASFSETSSDEEELPEPKEKRLRKSASPEPEKDCFQHDSDSEGSNTSKEFDDLVVKAVKASTTAKGKTEAIRTKTVPAERAGIFETFTSNRANIIPSGSHNEQKGAVVKLDNKRISSTPAARPNVGGSQLPRTDRSIFDPEIFRVSDKTNSNVNTSITEQRVLRRSTDSDSSDNGLPEI